MSDWDWHVGHHTDHGFTWGPFECFAMTHILKRGGVLGVDVAGQRRIQISVTEKGRNLRIFVDGIEWKAATDE